MFNCTNIWLVSFYRVSDTYNLTASLNRGKRQVSQMSSNQADKLKPINDQKLMSKKIRLCSIPKVEVMCNGIIKRKCDERNEVLPPSILGKL